MNLKNLVALPGARSKRTRVGRGPGSGMGTQGGRGHKGQNSRSGHRIGVKFEGGQMPLARRLPKRGFKNHCRKDFVVVNLRDLERCFKANDVIDPVALHKAGLINLPTDRVKILSAGDLAKALTVRAQRFSANAKVKIEAAGGKVELIERAQKAAATGGQEG